MKWAETVLSIVHVTYQEFRKIKAPWIQFQWIVELIYAMLVCRLFMELLQETLTMMKGEQF